MQTAKPSKTARKVALNIVTLGTKRGMEKVLPSGIVDATAKLLVESGAVGRKAVRFSRSRIAVGIYLAFDWMMPGQFEAFAHRKAFCERQVRKGIEAGASQVLVLGAGYDTLGWRLAPAFAKVHFFEIDHPATARLKAKGIEAMGLPTNLHLLAEDLDERRLVDVLHANATWNPIAPTVIVAEGLLMYLPPDAVGVLFEQCAAATGAGSRMAFTYIGSRSNGRPDAGPWTWLILWLLKIGGEPWLWSISAEEILLFLNEHGWTIAKDQTELIDKCGIEFHGIAIK
ncbi:MAG: SAM-dependent methyltransferase [Gammaproteobacteria bacterium]|nr:SAM-dependent methyltransferase [Gammaproteobacteria bacterium]